MAELEVVEGVKNGERFTIDGVTMIGRSLTNSICLPDKSASRQHARIFDKEGDFFLEDMKSANGTFLCGQPIPVGKLVALYDGDEIKICSTRMIFRAPESSLAEDGAAGTGKPGKPSGLNKAKRKTRIFPGVSIMMPSDNEDEPPPEVNLTLDASMSMVAVKEQERKSDKGLQDALRRLQAMCQVSEALGNILEGEALMKKIIHLAFDIFSAADRAFIMLREKDTGEFIPVAAQRRGAKPGSTEEIAISRSIINEVVENKHSILSLDAMQDDRFDSQRSIVDLSIRSVMCAPLLVGEEILGLIQVDSQQGVEAFNEEDLRVLTGICAQAAIAVKNVQLYEAVEVETARRTSLQRYFSPNMVEIMMSEGANTSLGGDTYRGTIFFSDIIGFTDMSESMDPKDLVARLNRYLTVMQKLIYDNGGNVDKFGGDAIMAFWSVPQYSEGDELRAVLTGVQMQGMLWPFNLELAVDQQKPIYMGIGINTGEFVAGNIGSEDKIEFTLIGDNVNLASRIESCAGRSQVLISQATWEVVRDRVCAVYLPPVQFKGKSKPSKIYSVRAVKHTDTEWAAALPAYILGADKHPIGIGMVSAITGMDSEKQLILNTTVTLIAEEPVALRLICAEYHRPLFLRAAIISQNTVEIRGGGKYTSAVLSNLQGEAVLELLTPGACLETELTWDQMKRE